MNLQTLTRIFEWFTTAELLLTRLVMFVVFLIGLWTIFQWARGHRPAHPRPGDDVLPNSSGQ